MKKIFVITKLVEAHSVVDALKKEKVTEPSCIELSVYSQSQWAEEVSPDERI